MPAEQFPVGLKMDVTYPNFTVSLTLLSAEQLEFEIKDGPFARIETVDIEVRPLGNGIFAVSWQEESGATVTNVQDHDRGVVHSWATLPDGYTRSERPGPPWFGPLVGTIIKKNSIQLTVIQFPKKSGLNLKLNRSQPKSRT